MVLGISGYFGSIFLPHLKGEFLSILPRRIFSLLIRGIASLFSIAEYTIYSLVVASTTLVAIVVFLTL